MIKALFQTAKWDDQDKYGVTREIAGRVSLPTQDLVRLHQLVPELESIIILLTDEFRVVPSDIALTRPISTHAATWTHSTSCSIYRT